MGIRSWIRQARRAEESPEPPYIWVPPGHYYSPLPAFDEISRDEGRIFASPPKLHDVDVRPEAQLALLKTLAAFYAEIPFPEVHTPPARYLYQNPAYSYGDAVFLHSMIRYLKPRRLIEVGSGWSSCATMDTNDSFFEGQIDCTFIDPYPETILNLLAESDPERSRLITTRFQDVDTSLFTQLQENDLLFIDSTHVAKTGSDVNHLFTEVLPRLNPGVHVHFHDIFYPFEYPRTWVYEGRAWSEAYVLRTFLQFNPAFEIVIWNNYLWQHHRDRLTELMPIVAGNPGASIWIKRVN